ncbi:FdtA/QdtA family cupin domain-containing protein [Xenorhabdus khoisanae]|uniref:sugar 3,4-ketoisomerase n=1 Tax=Xenorhabdus khoisanae TaxID=880157 RepID=UPI0023594674|nr:FdtA/QdtA family cupin domain-containing protein [Xenorhabdus khoisanae]MDC9615816.1 FdtA/QdtA family cupin domain-containing protein [Xenorhabdus khoisanae]
MEIKLIPLQTHGDARGSLVALEHGNNIPFEIKRVYYLFNTRESVERGFHAHRNLEQIAITVRGSCRFILDDGNERVSLLLDNPAQGLVVDKFIWHEMVEFSEDCVLMVLANELYDESDYIRNYNDFLDLVQRRA